MIEKLKVKFEDKNNNYLSNENNKVFASIDEMKGEQDEKIDIDAERAKHISKDSDRFVYACIANNEALPF